MSIAPDNIFPKERLIEYFANERRKDRIDLMQSGAREFANWLEDLFSEGVSALLRSNKFGLDSIAVRMVDTQNGSIARKLRLLAGELEKDNWDESGGLLLLFELYTLAKALLKADSLPILMKAETLSLCGMSWRKKDLEWVIPVNDQWKCLHHTLDWIENLRLNTCWMLGRKSGFYAQLNFYSFRYEPFSHNINQGDCWEGDLIYYPSPTPLLAYPSEVFYKIPESKFAKSTIPAANLMTPIDEVSKSNPLRQEWPLLVPVYKINTDALTLHPSLSVEKKTRIRKYLKAGKMDCSLFLFGLWTTGGFKALSLLKNGTTIDLNDLLN